MKTIFVLFAIAIGSASANASLTEKFTGLHFIITIDEVQLTSHEEFKNQVCDTLNENEYALFKSKDYILACRNKNLYEEKGVQAEVKAFFNDEEITMDDAYVMMNNRNVQEGIAYAEKSRQRLQKIIEESNNVAMHYSITVSMENDSTLLQAYCKEYVYTIKDAGNNDLLVIGKFITFTDVKAVYDEITAKGINNISITASEFGKEIPVSSAVGKEQEYLQQLLAINK